MLHSLLGSLVYSGPWLLFLQSLINIILAAILGRHDELLNQSGSTHFGTLHEDCQSHQSPIIFHQTPSNWFDIFCVADRTSIPRYHQRTNNGRHQWPVLIDGNVAKCCSQNDRKRRTFHASVLSTNCRLHFLLFKNGFSSWTRKILQGIDGTQNRDENWTVAILVKEECE
jgi:hypothetical protein